MSQLLCEALVITFTFQHQSINHLWVQVNVHVKCEMPTSCLSPHDFNFLTLKLGFFFLFLSKFKVVPPRPESQSMFCEVLMPLTSKILSLYLWVLLYSEYLWEIRRNSMTFCHWDSVSKNESHNTQLWLSLTKSHVTRVQCYNTVTWSSTIIKTALQWNIMNQYIATHGTNTFQGLLRG